MQLSERLGLNRIVVALSFARFGDAMGNSILIVVIPLYVAKLPGPDLPESFLVGLLISAYGIIFTFAQPFTGSWSDRLGRRKIFIQAGLFLMLVSTLAYILAGRFLSLVFIRLLQGVGVAFTVPASLAVMAEASERSTRGGSMGFFSMLRMAGFALGPLVGGLLQVHVGFNAAFLAGGGLLLMGMLMVQFWVKEPPTPVRDSADDGGFKLFDRKLLAGGLLYIGLAMFMMSSAFSMMSALENEFNQRLQQTAIGFGIAFSALTASRFLFQLPFGRLSDRIGRRPLIVLGLILMAPATLLQGLVTSTLQLTIVRVFQGFASSMIAAPGFALAGDISQAGGEGRQMSILAMGFGLGIAIGPLIAGSLATISFELPFAVGAVLSLIGAWMVQRFVVETVQPDES
ncbi:MAG: MFS transporter [Anaerolineales bacterium]|jgi:MFS family permease